ncbi:MULTISPECIES: BCCT family transporter [unclassified Leclercia]|uniref:BCCT family transporter n=1 Tax=Leclercia barmai TaxID=2785629 RepID=A0ABS7RT79_9ENTR|nr:BCCT family transporter [Leclercia sp. EMC7]MCM5700091.1 BCCT family transporter [Leclercia sp. LTM14]
MGLSQYDDIKPGPGGSHPGFRCHSRFAMIFSAGTGTGMIFLGAAEPVI